MHLLHLSCKSKAIFGDTLDDIEGFWMWHIIMLLNTCVVIIVTPHVWNSIPNPNQGVPGEQAKAKQLQDIYNITKPGAKIIQVSTKNWNFDHPNELANKNDHHAEYTIISLRYSTS